MKEEKINESAPTVKYAEDTKPLPNPDIDMTNTLNKVIYELECLEIAANKATLNHRKAMEKLGKVAREGTKPPNPLETITGKAMVDAVNTARAFQKENFGINSEPGIISPTVVLIRLTIKLMKEAGEL